MEYLDLIDWRMVAFGALWVTGLAIVVTALGFADYRRQREAGVGFREVLRRPAYQLAVNGGLALFCAGMVDSASATWEAVVWGLLAAAFAGFAWRGWRGEGAGERGSRGAGERGSRGSGGAGEQGSRGLMDSEDESQQLGPIVFLHIGKTGGTTLKGILEERFERSEICPVARGKNLQKLSEEQLKRYSLFIGHYSYQDVMALPFSRVTLLTMLRDPVERVISTYQQIARSEGHSLHEHVKHMSIDEFVRAELPRPAQIADHCTRMIAGGGDLDLAKRRVREEFAFVGITERFRASMLLLSYTLGWEPITDFRERNVTPNKIRREDLSPETLDSIRSMNALDLELYAYAEDLFDRQFVDMQGELLAEVYGGKTVASAEKSSTAEELAQELSRLQNTIDEIRATRGWQLLEVWWDWKRRFFPPGSKRLEIYEAVMKFLAGLAPSWPSPGAREQGS